jgi:hypothetical protein
MKLAGPIVLSSASVIIVKPRALNRSHDQPILRLVAGEYLEPQLFIKHLRRLDIFYRQAHGKNSQVYK